MSLVPFSGDLPDILNPYQEDMKELSSGSTFLPRVQLYIATSDLVKSGNFPMNHYGLSARKDSVEDLGREVDVLVITWRPRAMDTSDRANIRATSDIRSPLFAEIRQKAESNDQAIKLGHFFGPEYLIWVPTKETFATFLLGSVSAKFEIPNMNSRLKKPATLKSRLAKNKVGQTYQVPLVTDCSTPFDVPSGEEIFAVATDFLNPKEQTGPEKVTIEQRDR